MSNHGHGFEPRFKLEEAKFFLQQMDYSLQDLKDRSSVTKFLYFLDAFLAATRNVTFVFQKEFKGSTELVEWYHKKTLDWKKNRIMKLFIEMRNLSTKEHTPETLTLVARQGVFDVSRASVENSPDGRVKRIKIPFFPSAETTLKKNQIQPRSSVAYFYRLPQWFSGNPDVIHLCNHYLDELEELVVEAERRIPDARNKP